MIAARCVAAAGLILCASVWLGPRLADPAHWPLVASVAASLAFLVPLPASGGSGPRVGLAALAVWLPWAAPVAPSVELLAPGALLAVVAGLSAARFRGAGPLLLIVVATAGLVAASGALTAGEEADSTPRARGDWRVVEVPLELTGPLERATLAYDGYPPLEIEADLLAGESTAARAWIVAPAASEVLADGPPEVVGAVVPPEGAVRASGPEPAPEPPAWSRRPLPVLGGGGRVLPLPIPMAAALLAAAAAVLAGALAGERRLQGPAGLACLVLVGGGASAGTLALAGAGDDGRAEAHLVLEGRVDASGSLEWALSARVPGPLEASGSPRGGASTAAVLLEDPAGPLRTELRLEAGDATRRVLARAPGGPVDRALGGIDLGLRLLRPEVNTLAAMEDAWRQDEGSEGWIAAGAWALGQPIPTWIGSPSEAQNGSSGPPGWARSGLPMGEPLFVGRVAAGSPLVARLAAEAGLPDGNPASGDPGPGDTVLWVRVVGFGR